MFMKHIPNPACKMFRKCTAGFVRVGQLTKSWKCAASFLKPEVQQQRHVLLKCINIGISENKLHNPVAEGLLTSSRLSSPSLTFNRENLGITQKCHVRCIPQQEWTHIGTCISTLLVIEFLLHHNCQFWGFQQWLATMDPLDKEPQLRPL